MFEAIAAELIEPPAAYVQQVRKRGRSRSRERGRRQPARTWPYFVGAVILLDDGRECYVWQDRAGRWHCRPEGASRADSWRVD
jgi:hypothetical protein